MVIDGIPTGGFMGAAEQLDRLRADSRRLEALLAMGLFVQTPTEIEHSKRGWEVAATDHLTDRGAIDDWMDERRAEIDEALWEEPAGRCADCGAALNEGEAKTFTVCDACWDKHYHGEEPDDE